MATVKPSRILFTSRPLAGHFDPLLPLAAAARAAGHTVGFATGDPAVGRARDLGYAAFDAGPGDHNYAIFVYGGPAESWSATVKGGKKTFKHAGHMSSAGADDTGDTPYEV